MTRRLTRLSERDWRAIDRSFVGTLLVLGEANVFPAEPDTPNQQAMRFLASWAATTGREQAGDQSAPEADPRRGR